MGNNATVPRLVFLESLIVVAAACSGGQDAAPSSQGGSPPPAGSSEPPATPPCDWPRFGFDSGRTNAGPAEAGLPAEGFVI